MEDRRLIQLQQDIAKGRREQHIPDVWKPGKLFPRYILNRRRFVLQVRSWTRHFPADIVGIVFSEGPNPTRPWGWQVGRPVKIGKEVLFANKKTSHVRGYKTSALAIQACEKNMRAVVREVRSSRKRGWAVTTAARSALEGIQSFSVAYDLSGRV